MRRCLSLVAVLVAVLVPAAAQAAPGPTFSFNGRGFGHGVGMSQYGAFGAAKAGWDAPRILRHYYRGTELATIEPGAVRVLLAARRSAIAVTSQVPWSVVDETTSPETARRLTQKARYRVVRRGRDSLRIIGPGGRAVATYSGPVRFQADAPEGTVALGTTPYRGAMRVIATRGRLDAINLVDIEQYLYGVVPREMPARWGDTAPAALDAQAIAARTYAADHVDLEAPYDLNADQRSQVYGGVPAEDERTTAAVERTRGQTITYGGELITAFYFSTSGGRTERVENVFTSSEPVPYLVSVRDPFDRTSPYHRRWPEPVRVTGERLARLFRLPAPITSVRVLRRGASPRVRAVRLVSRSGRRRDVTGAEVRTALGLRDTWFYVSRSTRRAAADRR